MGRFVNADDIEIVTSTYRDIHLFAYCRNDPVNEDDVTGSVIASLIGKFVAGAVFGFFAQLFSDFIVYMCNKYVYGKSDAKLMSSNTSDYVSSVLTWALDMVNPFSKKLIVLFNLVPLFTKYVWKFIAGESIEKYAFISDCLATIVNIAIGCFLNYKVKQKLETLRKYRQKNSRNTELKALRATVKAVYNKWGLRISLSLAASPTIFQTIWKIL